MFYLMFIYLIQNNINGKKYVGQTIQQVKVRFMDHCMPSRKCLINKAIQKYGKTNFSVSTLQECKTIEELNDAETYWIAELETLSPKGYNLTTGGRHPIATDNINKQRSESLKGVFKHTEDTKERIRKAHLGRKITWGDKISQTRKSKNITLSEEAKQKFIEAGRKSVIKYHAEGKSKGEGNPNSKLSWEVVREIRAKYATDKYSQTSLSQEYNIGQTTISKIVRNKSWVENPQ